MNVEHWWNDSDGETEVLAEKLVSVSVYSSEIPHRLAWD
jgi:hypothetical protein